MRAETLKGHLDLLLLAVLDGTPGHGYWVVEALRDRSGDVFDLPEGTIYPALHRLERAGYIGSEWKTVDGRRRRVYALTESGTAALESQRRQWEGFAAGVQRVLKGTPWPNPSPA